MLNWPKLEASQLIGSFEFLLAAAIPIVTDSPHRIDG